MFGGFGGGMYLILLMSRDSSIDSSSFSSFAVGDGNLIKDAFHSSVLNLQLTYCQ
jgi:hypothetical protein